MTRCIGDFVYKRDPIRPVVIATPDVVVHPRNAEDEFVVVASDGLWSVFSEAEVCAAVRRKLRECDGSAALVVEYLVDQALVQGSRDNICVCLVVFPAAFRHLLPVHKSYSCVMGWGAIEVRQWLSTINMTNAMEMFQAEHLSGEFLLAINEENYKYVGV